MIILHPFMPFITEEVWQKVKVRNENETINFAKWPQISKVDNEILKSFSRLFELISKIRKIRKEKIFLLKLKSNYLQMKT